MSIDVAKRRFGFGFAPHRIGEFGNPSAEIGEDPYLQGLVAQISGVQGNQVCGSKVFGLESLVGEFPELFSSFLGTAKCVPYEIELHDPVPVRSPRIGALHPRRPSLGKWLVSLWSRASYAPVSHPMPARHFWSLNETGDFGWW